MSIFWKSKQGIKAYVQPKCSNGTCPPGLWRVRRESVTQAVGLLQSDGLNSARHGHIHVLNKPAMEARVCEYYEVVRKEYERLLPPVLDADAAEL